MDAVTWARRGLVDMLVVTPTHLTMEPDMPIELWKELLHGTRTTLAAGLELHLCAYPGSPFRPTNSLQTVRGASATLLDRGADRVYLFNFMDSDTAIADLENYPTLLRECGSPDTLAGKPRRHVVTFSDTLAPGEPGGGPLPATCAPGQWCAFRLPTGPKPDGGRVEARLGIEGIGADDLRRWELRLNGVLCPFLGPVELNLRPVGFNLPGVDLPAFAFEAPLTAINRGYNVLELGARAPCRVVWVELAFA
jgi:hypothetical protein